MRFHSTMTALVAAALLATSRPALLQGWRSPEGAETGVPAYPCDGGDVIFEGPGRFRCAPHHGFGAEDRPPVGDERDDTGGRHVDGGAGGRLWRGVRGFFRFDPSDTGYDDPLCAPDVRAPSATDCP